MTPKILVLDIENFPCEVWSWGIGEQHIPLDFLKTDWTVCAWSAHWVGTPDNEIMYMDNRDKRDVRNDKKLIKELVKLMNEADVIIGQNVQNFDIRKLAARAAFHKLPPFRPVKITDILTEERKVFAFTSHKLAYKTELNKNYKKLKHEQFPGFDLWKECMKGNLKAWKEMEKYCKHDVLSTEEHYLDIQGWIKTQNLPFYDDKLKTRCYCGSTNIIAKGYARTEAGKYQIYHCKDCGKWPRGTKNLLEKDKKQTLLRGGR